MTTGFLGVSSFEGLAAVRYRDAAATLKGIAAIRYRDADNVLQTIIGAGGFGFSASAEPGDVHGFGSSGSSIYLTTGTVTATVTGGAAPFTYAWEVDDPDWAAISATSSATSFRSPLLGPSGESFTFARCVVTDANAVDTTTNDVSLYATNLFGP